MPRGACPINTDCRNAHKQIVQKHLNALYYGILRYALFAISFCVAFALLTVGYYLEEQGFKALLFPIAFVMLIYVLAAKWFTGRIAHHMAFENRNLYMGIVGAAADARFYLGFLPLVGHWFMTPSEKSDVEPEDNNKSRPPRLRN